MKVFRAENPDGGGPFYHLDGTPRFEHLPKFEENGFLYGADSIENLEKIISSYGFRISDFIIKSYEVRSVYSYNKKNGHLIFEKGELL